jgi:hypothetical protein
MILMDCLQIKTFFLEDKEQTKIFDLKKEAYSFTTAKGTFDNRFELRFQSKNAVPSAISAEVQIVTRNNQIQINSLKETISQVSLYSLEGKQLYQVQQLKTKTHFIEAAFWKTKVLIVQITLETGAVVSRKVLL